MWFMQLRTFARILPIIRRTKNLQYRNGKEVLPDRLLNEIQQYIQGEIIYIPKSSNRAGWGEVNGSRRQLTKRNLEIYQRYLEGASIEELEYRYLLSLDSIRKIISKMRNTEIRTSRLG